MGTTICVDEPMSRWHGLGGSWISVGLPHYVAIDRKPDNGCEIHDAACVESGVIIRLKVRQKKTASRQTRAMRND
jgi:hypothetical protein